MKNKLTPNQYFDILVHRDRPVKLSEIPEPLMKDFRDFMFGQTVIKIDNEMAYFPRDFNAWVEKVRSKGLDYPIVLSK